MTPARHKSPAQRKVALCLGLLAGALGALVLVGWALDLPVLQSVFPRMVSMKANTALGMLLCGMALAILAREKVAAPARFWVTVMAAAVIVLGGLTLSEYLLGREFGVDQWLFRDANEPAGISQPGRMSPATAFCFVLTGVSLLVAAQPVSMRLRLSMLAALGLAVIVVGGLALTGYVSDALFGFRWWSYTGMAVHTAAGFILLGFGLLTLGRSEGGLKWSLDKLTTRGFIAGNLALVAAAGVSYHFTGQMQESAGWVSHTQEVLKEIGGVTTGVASLGSSQRSFINTGDNRFLEQEAGLKEAIALKIATLRLLTSDNPRQKPRLDQLAPLIAQRIDWGEQAIAARRKGGLSAAEQIIASGKGIELTDGIRVLIKQMEDEEYALLDQRQKKEEAISTTTFLLLPLGVFLSVALLSLGLFFLNTGMGERALAEEKALWLASFPERNPSYIVELDLATGILHYLNPFSVRLLPDLQSLGLRHPWLAGLPEAATTFAEKPDDPLRREIAAGGRYYSQTINYIPETKRVRVYGTDITERKQVEAEAARLAAIVKFSDDAIIGKDLHSIISSWNKGAEKIFGFTSVEMVGTSILRLIPADRLEEENQILERIKRGESLEHFETLRQTKDGRLINVSVTVSPIKDAAGTIIGVSKVARDITERKQAEAVLQATREEFKDLFDNAPIGYHELDAAGRLVRVNQTELKMLGYGAEELLGQFVWDISADPELARSSVLLKLSGMPPGARYERSLRRKDGSFLPVLVEDQLVKGADGAVSGIRTVFQDITERQQAEDKIRQLNADLEQRVIERTAQLEAANKELEAFSYSVSHDLRAPLRAVDGFSQAVIEDYGPQLPEGCRQDLQTIRNGAQKMGELIDDLLTFSRLSRMPLSKRTVDTEKLARGVFHELSSQLKRPISFRVADLPPCQADPALLKQVWVNLLSNALKYSGKREDALVETGCLRDKGQDVYFVRDNGAGFDMKYASKLFGVFQRLHRAEEYEGTGVGLAIVQRIVLRHGGKIWAESKVNHGATFYFTLEGETKL